MDKKKITSPSGFLQVVNERLFDLLPRGQFATFFFGIYDPKNKTLDYAAAGSPQPFWISGRKTTLLETAGMPLGIRQKASYESRHIQMKPGDSLMFYSDALTESPSDDGERLGTDGFKKLVEKNIKNENASVALHNIMGAFFEFAPPPPPDDVTAVLFRVKE